MSVCVCVGGKKGGGVTVTFKVNLHFMISYSLDTGYGTRTEKERQTEKEIRR